MFNSATKKKLKEQGWDIDKLIAAATHAEEQETPIPTTQVLTDEQLAERDKNTIAAAKPDILKEGKQTGIEIANKAVAKKFGLSDVDTKDPDKVITALEAAVKTGDTGKDERINLLMADNETLKQAVEKEKANTQAVQFDTELLTHFPANRKTDIMSDSEYLQLAKSNLQFETVDGVRVAKKDGQIMRDKTTQAPIAPKDAIVNWFNERKYVGEIKGQGRGGQDNPGSGTGGLKKMSQFQETWVKDNPGKNVLSPDFHNAIAKHAAENKDFDFDN